MRRFIIGLIKILIASLLVGVLLSFFGVTVEMLLSLVGQTPESFGSNARMAFAWALPKILLGAVIVLPVWFLTYVLLPPRD